MLLALIIRVGSIIFNVVPPPSKYMGTLSVYSKKNGLLTEGEQLNIPYAQWEIPQSQFVFGFGNLEKYSVSHRYDGDGEKKVYMVDIDFEKYEDMDVTILTHDSEFGKIILKMEHRYSKNEYIHVIGY